MLNLIDMAQPRRRCELQVRRLGVPFHFCRLLRRTSGLDQKELFVYLLSLSTFQVRGWEDVLNRDLASHLICLFVCSTELLSIPVHRAMVKHSMRKRCRAPRKSRIKSGAFSVSHPHSRGVCTILYKTRQPETNSGFVVQGEDRSGCPHRGIGHWEECAERSKITKRVMFIISLPYTGQTKQSAKCTKNPHIQGAFTQDSTP